MTYQPLLDFHYNHLSKWHFQLHLHNHTSKYHHHFSAQKKENYQHMILQVVKLELWQKWYLHTLIRYRFMKVRILWIKSHTLRLLTCSLKTNIFARWLRTFNRGIISYLTLRGYNVWAYKVGGWLHGAGMETWSRKDWTIFFQTSNFGCWLLFNPLAYLLRLKVPL